VRGRTAQPGLAKPGPAIPALWTAATTGYCAWKDRRNAVVAYVASKNPGARRTLKAFRPPAQGWREERAPTLGRSSPGRSNPNGVPPTSRPKQGRNPVGVGGSTEGIFIIAPLTQGGASLALGCFLVVPTGLRFGSIRSQVAERPSERRPITAREAHSQQPPCSCFLSSRVGRPNTTAHRRVAVVLISVGGWPTSAPQGNRGQNKSTQVDC
jgi:hypothetical protein